MVVQNSAISPTIDTTPHAAAMDALRRQNPRVHCITNNVAQHFSANVLLACGAVPSMTVAVEEITDFVKSADSLLVNLGTMDPERTKATRRAVEVAADENKPFVLDPVFVQASPVRLALARVLVGRNPAIIRANDAEVEALFGEPKSGDRVQQPAFAYSGCLVISGQIDQIYGGGSVTKIANGTAVVTSITAMGCALTALMAALAAVESDRTIAAITALLWFNIAAELAAQNSAGPGTFVPEFVDALATLDSATLHERAKLS